MFGDFFIRVNTDHQFRSELTCLAQKIGMAKVNHVKAPIYPYTNFFLFGHYF